MHVCGIQKIFYFHCLKIVFQYIWKKKYFYFIFYLRYLPTSYQNAFHCRIKNLPSELISYVYTFLLFQCLSLKWWITPMMKILKNSVQCVGIKCLDTITGSSPVKAARFAYALLPDKYKVQNQNKPLESFLKLN